VATAITVKVGMLIVLWHKKALGQNEETVRFSVSIFVGCILVWAGYRKALDTLIEGCFSFILLQYKERINKK